jgi:hypothetical protein
MLDGDNMCEDNMATLVRSVFVTALVALVASTSAPAGAQGTAQDEAEIRR